MTLKHRRPGAALSTCPRVRCVYFPPFNYWGMSMPRNRMRRASGLALGGLAALLFCAASGAAPAASPAAAARANPFLTPSAL
ncbi:MAG: hypothetical protein ACRET5_20175, partial [Steroidobacteraceae bacterium]